MRSYITSPCENFALYNMGGGTSHTTTTQELSPEQRALIEPVIPIAQKYLANPPKMYPGSGIVDFNPLQRQAQEMTLNAARGLLPTTNAIPGQLRSVSQGLSGLGGQYDTLRQQENFLTSGDVLKASSNPYLQGAIEAASRPTIQQFQQQILPGLQEDQIASGAYGGTRQGIAGGIAGQAAVQSLADIASRMSNENYQAGLGAMTQGLGEANQTLAGSGNVLGQRASLLASTPDILKGTLLPSQLTEGVGQQQQLMQQAKLSEQVQKFVNQQMIPFSVAQDVAQMAFGMPGGTTTSTSTQPGNPMMGIQAGLGAMGMLPMLMGSSDRRLKHVIEMVGKLADGLGLYRFRYLGHKLSNLGLLADEVEQLYPEAVRIVFGYRQVNYAKVPSWMEV